MKVKDFAKYYEKNKNGGGSYAHFEMYYYDYLDQASKVDYDLTDPYYLYPQDLVRAHDRVTAEYQRNLEEINRKVAREQAAKFAKAMKKYCNLTYESDGLIIRPAVSEKELIAEGNVLHHCIASYAGRVVSGKTAIFFVRKADEPDKPYYTLALVEDAVTQCRGMSNCGMAADVSEFVNSWVENVVAPPTVKKRKAG
jgi:hypothetical protein